MKIVLIIVVVIVVLGLLLYLFPVIQVCGNSMSPTYTDGEYIWGRRLYRKSKLKKGDVIIYTCPHDGQTVIKRIGEIIRLNSGQFKGSDIENKLVFYCYGDNPSQSFDSRNYGGVLQNYLICKAITQRTKVERIDEYEESNTL